MIFNTIKHTSSIVPVWGEIVCTVPNYEGSYDCPFLVYSTRGQIYTVFVLLKTGEIRAYGSDIAKLINNNEVLNFSISM